MSRQKLERRRRSGISTVVAVVIVALGVLGAIAAVQLALGKATTVLGRVHTVTHRLHVTRWTDSTVLTVGIVAGVVGLLLLLAGLLPARRALRRLGDTHPDTLVAISDAGLTRDLEAVAADVDGISSARVTLGRRRVRVRARSEFRDLDGLTDAVRTAVDARLAALAPVGTLRVRAQVKGSDPDGSRD